MHSKFRFLGSSTPCFRPDQVFLTDTKVCNLGVAKLVKQDVARLQIVVIPFRSPDGWLK